MEIMDFIENRMITGRDRHLERQKKSEPVLSSDF